MAMTHDYMDYLNEKVGICPAGSQEELQAANVIADLMRQHNVEPSVEEFDAKNLGGTMTAVLYVLAFIGIVIGGIGVGVLTALGFVLAVGPAVLFVLKYMGYDLLSGFGPTTRSQNVVAFHGASGPMVMKGNRPIVIIAHYDSPHENVLASSGVAPYLPLLWKASKFCVLGVAVCMLFQILVFLPEPFRRFMWIIGIVAALPLVVLGVTSVIEHFSNCTDGANDNKSGVAAMLGVLDKVSPSGLESVHGTESIEEAVEAMRAAAEAAAAEREAVDIDEPELEDGVGEGIAAAVPAAETYKEVVEYVPVKAEGVRHGADVVRSLGMLPDDCEVEYDTPKVAVKKRVKVAAAAAAATVAAAPAAADAEPAAPRRMPSLSFFGAAKNTAENAAENAAGAADVATDTDEQNSFDAASFEPAPYVEDEAEKSAPISAEQVKAAAAKAGTTVKDAASKVGTQARSLFSKLSETIKNAIPEKADEPEEPAIESAGDEPVLMPLPENDFEAITDAEFEQVDDSVVEEAPVESEPYAEPEPAAEPEAYAAAEYASAPAAETAPFVVDEQFADVEQTAATDALEATAPVAAVEEDAETTAETAAVSEPMVNFDGLEDGTTLDPDDTGLTAEAFDPDATQPAAPMDMPKPAAPEDPEWGKTSFRPQATNVARRATLFDLPDPSARSVDPFGTDPAAPKLDLSDQDVRDSAFDKISASSSFAPVDVATNDEPEPSVLDRFKGLFGSKKSNGDESSSRGGWKGGATTRSDLRVIDSEVTPSEEDMVEAVLDMNDDALLCHDIWFVALGASDCDHAGMRAFLAEHRSQIRGSFVINLDSIGAGELTLLTHEGLLVTRRADRRLLRILTSVASDLHIPIERSKYDWATTDATPAMLSSMRAVTIMGTESDGVRALSRTPDDVVENVVPAQAVAVTEAVAELIRRS